MPCGSGGGGDVRPPERRKKLLYGRSRLVVAVAVAEAEIGEVVVVVPSSL